MQLYLIHRIQGLQSEGCGTGTFFTLPGAKKSMMRKILLTVFLFSPLTAFSTELALQYYLPSVLGVTSGKAQPISHPDEEFETDRRFLIPMELLVPLRNKERFSLSWNNIVSFFVKDDSFASLNISTGIALFFSENRLPMTGHFLVLR